MSTKIGIGFNNHPDPLQAAQNAAKEALRQIPSGKADFGFLWTTPYYQPQEFLPALKETLPVTELIGCSTSHLFCQNRLESFGVLLVLISSQQMKFEIGQVTHLPLQDPREAGRRLIKNIPFGFSQKYRQAFLFFADGATEDPASLAQGASDALGPAVPILGLGTCEASPESLSYQYFQDNVLTRSVCGVLFDEKVHLSVGQQHGWKPLGKPRRITSATNNIIHTIDDQKAAEFYRNFFSETDLSQNPVWPETLKLRYPLGVLLPGNDGYLIRNISAVLDDGSIVCQDKIKTGDTVHLLLGNKRTCLQATEQAAYQARELMAGQRPHLILVFTSRMRQALMGRAVKEEIRIIKNILGDDIPLAGICTQKEIFFANEKKDNFPIVQNSSILIVTVS